MYNMLLEKMKDNKHMRQDIIKTVSGAVNMSKLVKENRYDECVLKQIHSLPSTRIFFLFKSLVLLFHLLFVLALRFQLAFE
jgi:hypothetical protein